MEIGVLKNFAKFTGKQLCQSLFLNKITGHFLKNLWHRCIPVNLAKFLRTPSDDCSKSHATKAI